MEQMFKKSLSIALLMSAFVANAGPVVSQIKIRPQSLDNARKVAGEAAGTGYDYGMEEWWMEFDTTFEYQRSFGAKLAPQLFGDALQSVKGMKTKDAACNTKCGQMLVIQGTDVAGDLDPKALRAEQFYLDESFSGTLSFKPSISSAIVNFNFSFGFDEWWHGGFARIYAPFVHTKWNLNMTENVIHAGENKEQFSKASQYFAGEAAPEAFYGEGNNKTAIIRNPLNFHKISSGAVAEGDCKPKCGGLTRSGFGEIRGELGWNFWRHEDYGVGIYLAGAAPTAPRAKADFLFSTQIGNNKHWEFGAGATGHWVFWRSADEESHVGVYTDLTVTHLFKAREQRVLDLKGEGKELSRYLLAAKMVAADPDQKLGATETAQVGVTPIAPGSVTPARFRWANELTPVANLTGGDYNVTIGAQLDLAAWVNYTMGGLTIDLGYDLWMQTCEKYGCIDKCGPRLATEKDTWVLMGDAFPVGEGKADEKLYPLSFSDNDVTLMYGERTEFALDNRGIDKGAKSFAVNQDSSTTVADTYQALLGGQVGTPPTQDQTRLTLDPRFISMDDVNLDQKSQAMTHKVWGYAGYRWDREGVVPFFGIGGGAEFAAVPCVKPCEEAKKPNCPSCIKSGVSQWQIFAKVGFAFD